MNGTKMQAVRTKLWNTRLAAWLVAVVCVMGGSPPGARADQQEFKPLFDGKTLDGWTALPGGTWEVVDGVIVGTSPKNEKRHGILLSDRAYGDFTVRAKFRVLKGNSGFYFRSEHVKSDVAVHGFQIEVDPTQATGGLYETGGRAWVVKPDADAIKARNYQPGEWTDLELKARGRQLVVEINGVKSAELKDDPGRQKGHFGLQLHGGMEMHVEFKDVQIAEQP